MAIVFVLGAILGMIAPLLRRRRNAASAVLAAGAAILIAPAILDFVHPDARIGQAALDANRRFYLLLLACELPVLALAIISWGRSKKAFWLGWAIHVAFTVWLIVMLVWLEFFWHW